MEERKWNKWDRLAMTVCEKSAELSTCLSRQIGVVLLQENRIISTGYNGPAEGVTHCGTLRWDVDEALTLEAKRKKIEVKDEAILNSICPRRILDYKSGEGMHLCPAIHAEMNAIISAARVGIRTAGSSLYINNVIPCHNCLSSIINAGIKEIICLEKVFYSPVTEYILKDSGIAVYEYPKTERLCLNTLGKPTK